MNITFVTNTLGMGGAEKMVFFLAHGLVGFGHKTSIININTCHDLSLVPYDLEVRSADITYRGALRTNYDYVLFTVLKAKELKSDIIIGFLEIGNFCAALAGKLLHIPTIISERADPFVEHKNMSKLLKIKYTLINNADGAVFQTLGASKFYSKKLQDRSAIIANPITVDKKVESLDYNNLPKVIVSIGRLDNKQKRLDVTINAFKIFHQRHPEYLLKIYGKGPDLDSIKFQIHESGLDDVVYMMGPTNDPLTELSKAGMFLITSDYEGISNALLEAMALGVPVVSTDHTPGGARLLIKNMENGILVPIHDIDAIANALDMYASNPKFAKQCGENATNVLTRFSSNDILSQWDNYIKRIYANYKK